MPVVVPHYPGVQELWQDAKEKDLVLKLERGFKEGRAYLPPKMLKSLSRTDNLGHTLKQDKKKQKNGYLRRRNDRCRFYICICVYVHIHIFIYVQVCIHI